MSGNVMSDDILVAEGLSVHYGAFCAVNALDLRVRRGSVHSLIGPNGAGKTTAFNALCGIAKTSRGTITYLGERIERLPVARRSRKGLARSFQITNLFFEVDVRENVRLACQSARGWRSFDFFSECSSQRALYQKADEVLAWAGLQAKANALAGELSHGEQRRLEIALAVACDPTVLFLDEPTAGMGVEDIAFAKQLISNLSKQRQMTIVLIEHNMSLVMDISDRITVLQQGQKVAEGDPVSIRKDPVVRAAYLGE